jgi:hypothetical protein
MHWYLITKTVMPKHKQLKAFLLTRLQNNMKLLLRRTLVQQIKTQQGLALSGKRNDVI